MIADIQFCPSFELKPQQTSPFLLLVARPVRIAAISLGPLAVATSDQGERGQKSWETKNKTRQHGGSFRER
jgi:hypothetical protein